MSNATPEVLAMAHINFSGNIIPNTWYQHLRYGNGKPNLNAIVVLSDIVYWYRPTEIRDELTGQTIGYSKKFASDKLQRSYSQLSDQFGLTKKQARDAVNFLAQKGVITKELRQIDTANGPLSNVLYIGIVPDKIAEISLPIVSQVTPIALQVTPPSLEVTPSLPVSHTYTETTTKNTTEIFGKSKNSKTNGNISSPRLAKIEGLANAIAKAANTSDAALVKSATQLAVNICDIVCKLDLLTIVDHKTQSYLISVAIALAGKGVSPADLTAFSAWWYDNTWQGKKGQPPSPQLVGDSWGQFEASRLAPLSPNGSGPILTPAELAAYQALIAQENQ